MIRVFDDWYIVVETNPVNYVVRRGKGERDKKGTWMDKPAGYLTSLRGALGFIRRQIIAESLSDGERTLRDAIAAISEASSYFDAALAKEGLED